MPVDDKPGVELRLVRPTKREAAAIWHNARCLLRRHLVEPEGGTGNDRPVWTRLATGLVVEVRNDMIPLMYV